MPAPFHNIRRKLEDAWEIVITDLAGSNLTAIPIFKSFGQSVLKGERIEIVAPISLKEKIGSTITGNHFIEFMITLVSIRGEETRDSHGDRSGELGDIMARDDLPSLLSVTDPVIADFHAFDDTYKPGTETDTTENEFEIHTEFAAQIKCAPKDF